MSNTINIYQIMTRLFASKGQNKQFGTIEENGCTKFNDFTPKALEAIKDLGITHIWYTGLIEHATVTDYSEFGIKKDHPAVVKGRAGSPYAIKDYFDVCPDFAEDVPNRMAEFEALVKRTHDSGLKMIIDFVPNHVARQYKSDSVPEGLSDLGKGDNAEHAFDINNNFYYLPHTSFSIPWGVTFPYVKKYDYNEIPAKATGNDAFTDHPSIDDWYETIKLNYGIDYFNSNSKHFDPIPDTWNKMLSILLHWAEKGVDGFRCDMAEMVPVEFWGWVIPKVKEQFPEILFIAEVYDPNQYRSFIFDGKFDYLYDKVGLYDIVRAVMEGHGSAREITDCWKCYDGINEKMLRFLENHDEQRIASENFAAYSKPGIPGMIVSTCLNVGPTMVYFGQELGEKAEESEGFSGWEGRTSIFDYWEVELYQKWVNDGKFDGEQLDEEQKELQNFYKTLLNAKINSPALSSGGFYDLMYANQLINTDKLFAFARHTEDEALLVVCNFDREENQHFILRIPEHFFEHIGYDLESEYRCVDILGSGKTVLFKGSEVVNDGIALHMDTCSGYIFKLEKL